MITIDLWIGKNLFVPLIIRICQALGWSQWRFSAFAVLTGFFIWLYNANGIVDYILVGLMGLFGVIPLIVRSEEPRPESFIRRAVFFSLLLLSIVSRVGSFACIEIFFLASEYALTIKTIPPQEKKIRKLITEKSR